MNNRGQSLIMFVLILPLIVLVIAFVIDSSFSIMEKNRLDGIITSNMKEALKSNIRDSNIIKNAIINNEKLDVIVTINDDELKVVAKSKKNYIFGNLLKFNYYNLEFNYCGNYTNLDINKKCG